MSTVFCRVLLLQSAKKHCLIQQKQLKEVLKNPTHFTFRVVLLFCEGQKAKTNSGGESLVSTPNFVIVLLSPQFVWLVDIIPHKNKNRLEFFGF